MEVAGGDTHLSPKIKIILEIMLLAVAIGVVAITLYLFLSPGHKDKKATIKNNELTLSNTQISKLTQYPTEVGRVSDDQARTIVVQQLKTIAVADSLGVKPASDKVSSREAKLTSTITDKQLIKRYKDSLHLQAQVDVINDMIENPELAGYIFEFYWGQHIQYGWHYEPAGLNDPKLIKADKDYAKKRADHYYSAIKGNKMSAEAAIKEILADPKLGGQSYNNSGAIQAGNKDLKTSVPVTVDLKYVNNYLAKNNHTGLSQVLTGKSGVGYADNVSQQDMYYYFVRIDKTGSLSVSAADFSHKVNNLKVKYEK